jgi:microsomal dipeptidase-like Zn-dependent dipeptidase
MGCQMSPFGFLGLDQAIPVGAGDMAGAVAPQVAEPEPTPSFVTRHTTAQGHPVHQVERMDAVTDSSPRGVVKAAKARVKAIRAELKNMKALQKELAELERLIDAAKKPLAPVRDIRRSVG